MLNTDPAHVGQLWMVFVGLEEQNAAVPELDAAQCRDAHVEENAEEYGHRNQSQPTRR